MKTMRSFAIPALCALTLLALPREARASLITYEFTAKITAVTTHDDARGAAALALLNSLGGNIGGDAFGTFSFYTEAIPSIADPSFFSTSKGPVASISFGTSAGLSIFYSATEPMSLRAMPTQWIADYGMGPTAKNVDGFEYTILQLLSNGGALSGSVPILDAFDPEILDHGVIHFGGSYAYPLDVRADVSNIRQVPEPAIWMLILAAGLIEVARRRLPRLFRRARAVKTDAR